MADFDPSSGLLLTNPRTGAQVAAWLNELAAFLMSTGYGGAVPTHAEAGHIWSKNTGGAPDPMMFDGASSFQLYTALNAIGAVSGDGAAAWAGAAGRGPLPALLANELRLPNMLCAPCYP